MKNTSIFLLVATIFSISACSTETMNRTAYETLQNLKDQQCQKEVSSECPQRERFEVYKEKRKDLGKR